MDMRFYGRAIIQQVKFSFFCCNRNVRRPCVDLPPVRYVLLLTLTTFLVKIRHHGGKKLLVGLCGCAHLLSRHHRALDHRRERIYVVIRVLVIILCLPRFVPLRLQNFAASRETDVAIFRFYRCRAVKKTISQIKGCLKGTSFKNIPSISTSRHTTRQ